MAELGVREVDADRRRGLPARRLVDDHRARIRARGHAVHDDHGRPRPDARARAGGGGRGPPERERVDRRPRGDARSPARRARARTGRRWRRCATCAPPACASAVNTQINRLSMPELPESLETVIALGAHSWQIQLTVAMGRAADEPDVLLQPYDLLELFPLLARARSSAATSAGVRSGPATTSATSARTRSVLRGTHAARAHGLVRRRAARTLGIEADGAIKGCPSLPTEPGRAATSATPRCRTSGSARRRCATRATAPSTICGASAGPATTPTSAAPAAPGPAFILFGKPGNNPSATTARWSCSRQGKRERLVQVDARARRTVRPRHASRSSWRM